MVPVKQKDSDEIRITVNFSRLNAKTKNIAFPMTNPTTLLGKVAGKKWVSSLDMRQSFFPDRNTIPFTLLSDDLSNKQEVHCVLGW